MTIYQILPRLYGTGHFSEFDSAFFDYVKKLGVTHVWYTGIPKHSTGKDYVKGDPGSPYSVADYYDVNPYFADDKRRRMKEFEAMVERNHSAGLKVITDFVPNHISPDYSDKKGGIPHFDFCDYDWTDTLKIDYSAEGTWEKMLDIVLFWASKGVDGFRCDMVEMVPPEFFRYLISEVKAKYPETIFIAEVYTKDRYWQYIKEVGFDYLYDKSGLYDALKDVCHGGSARQITWNWQSLGELQGNMLNFLENHDEQRFASPYFGGNAQHTFAPLAVSALLTSAPFMIYFGEEIGIDAAESDNGRTSIFSWSQIPELDRLHSFINTGKGLKAAEKSLLTRFRKVMATRSKTLEKAPEFWDLCYCQNEGFDAERQFAFARYGKKQAGVVVANFSGERATLDIRIPEEFPVDSFRGKTLRAELEPYDCTIL